MEAAQPAKFLEQLDELQHFDNVTKSEHHLEDSADAGLAECGPLGETDSYSIVDGENYFEFGDYAIPSNFIVFTSRMSVAFMARSPIVPHHMILLPKRRVSRLRDLTTDEMSDMATTSQYLSSIVTQLHHTTGNTFILRDGEGAAQGVPHVHMLILPRCSGDFAVNDDIYTEVEKYRVDVNDKANNNNYGTIHELTDGQLIESAKKMRDFMRT